MSFEKRFFFKVKVNSLRSCSLSSQICLGLFDSDVILLSYLWPKTNNDMKIISVVETFISKINSFAHATKAEQVQACLDSRETLESLNVLLGAINAAFRP